MKKNLAIFLTVIFLLSLAGCNGTSATVSSSPAVSPSQAASPSQAPSEEPAPDPVTLNVAYMPNYAALWAVTTGIEQGFFQEQGITVNLIEFADGPTEIAAMESGSIDLSYIGPGAHRLCSSGNASIFLIQQMGNTDCVIGLKSKGVNSLADLKGKTVAYASGTSSESMLNLALDSVGLKIEDIKAMDMDTSNMVTAMISGSVDACSTWSPNSLNILKELGDDAVKFCSNIDFTDVAVSPASWVCTPTYAEQSPDIIVRFIKSLYKAMDYGSQEENFSNVATWVSKQCATDYETAYDQRGDAKWYTGNEVIEMAQDGTLFDYYGLQQENFIKAGNVDAATALKVQDFVLIDLMIQAGDIYK